MDEKQIERNLVKKAEKMGGVAFKFVSPGLSGVPDRIVLLPGGYIGFVELKAPGKKMRPLQEKRKAQLEALGFLVFCLDSIDGAEEILNAIQTS
ncbi:VRR-NUC domain-containing protein [Butyrivibrio sp. MB2005]|uniref:VRR-NUC domain-containing protein n=1 Tax=Butyrivibrio sp. MB2005 TaxID=1280678 RepID=UPI0003F92D5C|nr:VRR-NUC domain-containing protein [Butyrivibrio sp. MB2005]